MESSEERGLSFCGKLPVGVENYRGLRKWNG